MKAFLISASIAMLANFAAIADDDVIGDQPAPAKVCNIANGGPMKKAKTVKGQSTDESQKGKAAGSANVPQPTPTPEH